jgi:hypothetical protein
VEDGPAQLARRGHRGALPAEPPDCGCGGADRRRAATGGLPHRRSRPKAASRPLMRRAVKKMPVRGPESPGPRARVRDHRNTQNRASELQLCRAAYRNRTDDLRITRRIRVVHSCPDGHTCPARAASQSPFVRSGPGPLLANPLAPPISAAAPTAPHPGRAALGRPPPGRTPGACAADDASRERLLAPARFPRLRGCVRRRPRGFATWAIRSKWCAPDVFERS